MTSNMTSAVPRPKLNFDIGEDVPETQETIVRKLEEISEQTGFTARAARPASSKPKPAAPPKETPSEPKIRRKWGGTTRPEAFNTKLRAGYHQRIIALADSASEKEQRLVTIAEIIERGTELLEAQNKNIG